MNSKLDILIEQYLDGNINKKDRVELNHLLESDIDSKNAFHNADALQKLLQKDIADIEYPEDFFGDVQDLILMKYLQEAPKEATVFIDLKNAYPKKLYTYARYAAVFAIFFLASIISINEISPWNYKKSGDKQVVAIVSNKTNTVINDKINSNNDILLSTNSSTKKASRPLLGNSEKANIGIALITSTGIKEELNETPINNNKLTEDGLVAELPQIITPSEIYAEDNTVDLAYTYNNISPKSERYNSINELNFYDNKGLPREFRDKNQINNIPTLTFGLDDIGFKKINFNTSASNGFASFGLQLANKSITSYSQSVSYNIDKKSTIGVELGLTEFSAKVLRDVILVSPGQDDNITGRDLIRIKLPLQQKARLIWTTIFYERDLLQLKNTNISARMGVGLTESDPVYMAKILGKQRIYKDLYITMGVDTRYYKTSINGTINGNYLSTFNIIYGLQYSL